MATGNFLHAAPGQDTTIGLDPRLLFGAAAVTIARLTLGVLGYVGAELTVAHTQDARYGHNTIARATIAATAITATVLLGGLVATVVVDLDTLLGVPADSSVPDVVRISYLALFAAGVLRAVWLHTHRPGAYAVIGTARTAPQ